MLLLFVACNPASEPFEAAVSTLEAQGCEAAAPQLEQVIQDHAGTTEAVLAQQKLQTCAEEAERQRREAEDALARQAADQRDTDWANCLLAIESLGKVRMRSGSDCGFGRPAEQAAADERACADWRAFLGRWNEGATLAELGADRPGSTVYLFSQDERNYDEVAAACAAFPEASIGSGTRCGERGVWSAAVHTDWGVEHVKGDTKEVCTALRKGFRGPNGEEYDSQPCRCIE